MFGRLAVPAVVAMLAWSLPAWSQTSDVSPRAAAEAAAKAAAAAQMAANQAAAAAEAAAKAAAAAEAAPKPAETAPASPPAQTEASTPPAEAPKAPTARKSAQAAKTVKPVKPVDVAPSDEAKPASNAPRTTASITAPKTAASKSAGKKLATTGTVKPDGKGGRCTELGFLVNDYGKDGPARDAQALLEKHIVQWTAEQKITKYTVSKKEVTCELFLNFIVFDEHTCTAHANVCW